MKIVVIGASGSVGSRIVSEGLARGHRITGIGVTLIGPFDGTTFTTLNPIPLSAWTYLRSGAMTSVEFFVDGIKIGDGTSITNSVSRFNWTNVFGGSMTWLSAPRGLSASRLATCSKR